MEKTAISGGGGGSDGSPVSIPEWAISAGRERVRPPDSWTLKEYAEATGLGKEAAASLLNELEQAGKIISKKIIIANGPTWFYWPAPNPKARKG